MTPCEDLGGWLSALRAQASSALGQDSEVVHLESCSWEHELLEICLAEAIPHRAAVGEGLPGLTTSRSPNESHGVRGSDWAGQLVLWPDSPRELRACRQTWLDKYSYQRGVTALVGRDRATIDLGIVELRDAWIRWRRTRALVRTTAGKILSAQPTQWDALVLPADLVDDVRTTVEGFAAGKALYEAAGIPWKRGLLFHGPPGNGKTLLCRAIVDALHWPATLVTPRADFDESELSSALDDARALAPSVLFFEDLDSLFKSNLTLSTFLNLLDGFESHQGVLVVATTNHPDKLDASVTARPSRFDRVFCIEPPAREARERYLRQLFRGRVSDEHCAGLARDTEGFSMAFLKELFLHACQRAAARGSTELSGHDLEVSYSAVSAHVKGARRLFSSGRGLGFVRPSSEPPPARALEGLPPRG